MFNLALGEMWSSPPHSITFCSYEVVLVLTFVYMVVYVSIKTRDRMICEREASLAFGRDPIFPRGTSGRDVHKSRSHEGELL